MRRILIAVSALSLAGCTTLGVPASPQAAANQVVLDEQALLAVELAYKGARTAVEIYVDTGRCTGACATRFRDLNQRAYTAVRAARAAYNAANAQNYEVALIEVRASINELLALTGRNN